MDEPQLSVEVDGTIDRPRSLLDLGLRGPTLGVLQRQGVLSVDQLVEMSPDDLMGLRRVGLSRMLEVRKALQSHGLDLQASIDGTPDRMWALSQRVSLTCCDLGDCALELRTAGADEYFVEAIMQAFVEAHRGCPRLNGGEPTAGRVETSRTVM
jgi:hypothetical protein